MPLLFKGEDERKLVKVQEGWLQLDPKGDWITESIYGITRTHDQQKEQPVKSRRRACLASLRTAS
jgi:hypothetical protein